MADLGFHIPIFMLKISGIRPSEYNKSFSSFHHESNKIGFEIFWMFYDFLEIF
jgi:hypothetical protein